MSNTQLTSPTNEQELDINRIEEIIADHNKEMRTDMASEIVGGTRSKAITDVITVKAIIAHTNAEIAKTLDRIDKANHAESCVPDCDEVRHARHEGEWAVYSRVDEAIQAERAKLKGIE